MPRGPQKRSEATREALIAAGRRLFAERGYAAVRAEDLVAETGLTRGALHHQFGDKSGLFQEVHLTLERELVEHLQETIADEPTVAGRMMLAVGAVLDACESPELVRIALLDAPGVLGWEAWREVETEHGLGLVVELLQEGIDTGVVVPGPVDTLAQIVVGSVIECALLIAHADDPAQARQDAEVSLGLLLAGLLVPTS